MRPEDEQWEMTTEELTQRLERAEAQAAVATGLLRRMKQRGEDFGPDAAAAAVVLSADGGRQFVENMGTRIGDLREELVAALKAGEDNARELNEAWEAAKKPLRGMVPLSELIEGWLEDACQLRGENKLLQSQLADAEEELMGVEALRAKSAEQAKRIVELQGEEEAYKLLRIGYRAKKEEVERLEAELKEVKMRAAQPDIFRLTALSRPPPRLELINTATGRMWRVFRVLREGEIEIVAENYVNDGIILPKNLGVVVTCLRGLVENEGLGDLIRKLTEAEALLATLPRPTGSEE